MPQTFFLTLLLFQFNLHCKKQCSIVGEISRAIDDMYKYGYNWRANGEDVWASAGEIARQDTDTLCKKQ